MSRPRQRRPSLPAERWLAGALTAALTTAMGCAEETETRARPDAMAQDLGDRPSYDYELGCPCLDLRPSTQSRLLCPFPADAGTAELDFRVPDGQSDADTPDDPGPDAASQFDALVDQATADSGSRDAGAPQDAGFDSAQVDMATPFEDCLQRPAAPIDPFRLPPDDYCLQNCTLIPYDGNHSLSCDVTDRHLNCTWDPICICGRRPPGATAPDNGRRDLGLGGWLGEVAGLEAASVHAFEHLARALRRQHAPKALIAAAKRAADDERSHARIVTRLAARHGAQPRLWACDPVHGDLFDLALDNRVEGCVRETFGAAQAAWQARHATDPTFRRAFERIARDEARHAALAWSIAQWVEPKLTTAQLGVLQAATQKAIAELGSTAALPEQAREQLGLPDALGNAALLKGLAPIWAA